MEAEFDRSTRTQPRPFDAADRARIRRLAEEVPKLWRAPTTPEDRRQVVRLLMDRVVLTVDPGDDHVAVRLEWAGGTVRERTIHRAVQGYRNQQAWASLAARLATLQGRGETPKAIAAILDRDGFRPPKRASRFRAGMVRRLFSRRDHDRACRARQGPPRSCRRTSGGCTTWRGTWVIRRTRSTGGETRVGSTSVRSGAVAARRRCGRTRPSWLA